VLKQVQAQTGGRLPALIVTARDGLENRLLGLNSGADDYILKPFELVELEARLRVVLRRPGRRGSTTNSFGRLMLDPRSRQVFVEGVAIELTRRELALLEELLRAAGRIVVKDALEDRLYSLDKEVSSNAIEATVSRLRRKLAAADASVSINTVRGIGYRIVLGNAGET
jgi:DNA-binding response OmpR family regulator